MKKDKATRKKEIKEALIRRVKALIFPVIMLAIIVGAILFVINYKNSKEPTEVIKINGYEGTDQPIVIENKALKFTLDPTTTHFEVEVKKTGKVWKSNPDGVEGDTVALQKEKGRLNSTIVMSYVNDKGLETTFDNYNYGIQSGVYEIESTDDSITIHYSIGETEKEYVIPPVCLAEEFEAYLEQMNLEDKNMVKEYYKKIDIENLKGKDAGKEDEYKAKYPILEEGELIYILRDSTKDNLKVKFEGIFEGLGYTLEQWEADKSLDFSESSSDKPVFNINMTYKLDGDDLLVTLPISEMEYKDDNPLFTLTPLPYFGAGGKDDNGFMLVPEGGGALINFNNGKVSQSSYYANMYGWDMCLIRDAVVHNTRSYYNVFGISDADKNSFTCTIESGAPYGGVFADVAGKTNSYNYVNSKFNIVHREQYDVGDIANVDVYVFQENLPEEDIVMRYRFVDSADYSDMAKNYQEYLLDKYPTIQAKADTDAPVNLEIVTAVDKKKQILGIPVSRPLELTTFEEAQTIVEELSADGLKNMSVKLTGWCNGGVKQHVLNRISTTSGLGGSKKLQNMINKSKELGVDVYLNGITHYAYDSDLLDGFFSYTDAAKFISKERAELQTYSDITYTTRDGLPSYYLLHTDEAIKMGQNLIDEAKDYGAGVSYQDTGMDLSSDFYIDNTVSRQEAQNMQVEQLRKAYEDGTKLMVNMGNDYALPYVSRISNMDLRGSEYTILDEFVPFYQMAIHGYVDYVGEMLNVCGNTQEELLTCAEYGAGLAFSLMDETPFTLQKTLYTEYYGSEYSAWHDSVVEIYNRYNNELGHVFNQKMVDHQTVGNKLTCTTYEDGTKVYVNYSYADAEANGVKVPARDYKVVR